MSDVFTTAFNSTFLAVLKILIVVIAAGWLVRAKIITQEQLKALSAVTVRVFLPCLIFSNIIRNFYPDQLRIWWVLPLSAVLMIAVGIIFGSLLFIKELPAKKNMLSVASMQNAGYFILPLGEVLFADQTEKFRLYCFLFILGISPIMWSLGKFFISSKPNTKLKASELITMPFIANIASIILVFTGLRMYIPSVFVDSVELVGKATVPTAIFILGGMLGGIALNIHHHIFDAIRVILVKMFLIPACTIAILYFTKIGQAYPLLASFLVLEASSAPATANLLQAKHYGGNENQISSVVLLNYIVAIISIPLWYAIWQILN